MLFMAKERFSLTESERARFSLRETGAEAASFAVHNCLSAAPLHFVEGTVVEKACEQGIILDSAHRTR